MRTGGVALFLLVLSFGLAVVAEADEPVLISASIPRYPPLARQARVQGTVKVTFTLGPRSAEPTNVQVVSGHKMLGPAAIENIKTWRFENGYNVERKYETTFDYRFGNTSVCFHSFGHIEVEEPEPLVIANP
ncbi:MAG TPA: energy transducer TonB [Candidatus Aquilonibacter sp.]|nr:energy transducer TonB [Candidatus Aquilonibacter sp.]